MLRTSSNVTREQMAVCYEDAKVEVGVETYATSEVALPPVPKLLQGERPVAKPQSVHVSYADESTQDALSPELDRLLSKRNEFGSSPTYLAQASSLAVLCGRLDDAHRLAEDARKEDPEDDDVAYRYARVAFYRGDSEAATTVWRQLADGGDLRSSLRMVELCVLDGDLEQADTWVRRAMELDSLDWRVHMLAGTLALIAGQGAKAIHHHRLALAERPRSVRLHYTLALAQASTGHVHNALRAIRVAVGLDPFWKVTLVAWADLCREDGAPRGVTAASRALARFLELYPDDKSVIERHARLLYEQDNFRAAQRVLSEARRRLQDATIVNNLGVLAVRSNNHRLAVQEFNHARQIADSQHDHEMVEVATANLVRALLQSDSVDRAAATSSEYLSAVTEQSLLTADPGYHIADVLVRSYVRQHKLPDAISLAQRWMTREVHPELHTNLAEVLVSYFSFVDVQPEQAHEFALVAHKVQSSLPTRGARWNGTLNNLVFTLIELERLDEAESLAGQLRAGPGDADAVVYATRGLLAIRRGRVEKGEALYERGISLAVSKDIKSRMRQKLSWELGTYWASQGAFGKARRLLERAKVLRKEDDWPMRDIQRKASKLLSQL